LPIRIANIAIGIKIVGVEMDDLGRFVNEILKREFS